MTRGYQRFRMLFPSSRHSSLGFASVSHLLSSDRPIFLVGLWLVALSCFWFHPNSRSLHQSMATFFFWLQPSSMVTSQPLGIDVPSPPEAIEESLRGTEVCWMEIYILDTPVTTRNFHHCFPMVKNPPKKIQKCRHWKEKNMAISDWNILELASINLWKWSFHVFPTFLVTSNPWRKNGNSTSNISHPNQGAGARRCPHGTAHCGWHCLGHQNSHKLPADSIAKTLGFWWFSMFFPTKVFCSFFLHSQSIT